MKRATITTLLCVGAFITTLLCAYACDVHPTKSSPIASAHELAKLANLDLVAWAGDIHSASPTKAITLRFAEETASLTRSSDGFRTSLTVKTERRATRVIRDGRLVYDHADFEEWYQSGHNGLEHGFTIPSPLKNAHAIEITFGETTLTELRGSREVLLRQRDDAHHAIAFHYGALAAFDHRGRELEASFELNDDRRVRIVFDDRNAEYPITIDPLIWTQETKLTELHAEAEDRLSGALAMSGTTVVASFLGRDQQRGGAAIFERNDGGVWTETVAPRPYLVDQTGAIIDGGVFPSFGYGIEVAADHNTLAVSSLYNVDVIKRQDDGGWVAAALLSPPSPYFLRTGVAGSPIAIQDNTIAMFAPYWGPGWVDASVDEAGVLNIPPPVAGGLFVYDADGGDWQGGPKMGTTAITPTRLDVPMSDTIDFGVIALSGNTLAVTSNNHIYTYQQNGTGGWSLEGDLIGPDPADLAFASTFALSGDTIFAVSGASGGRPTGWVYIFTRVSGAWTRSDTVLMRPYGGAGSTDGFGSSVAFANGDAFIGDNTGVPGGSVFHYAHVGETWVFVDEIAPDLSATSRFGSSLAGSGGFLAIGDFAQSIARGAVYIYHPTAVLGDACATADQCGSAFCVDGVCCDTACGNGLTDDCLACDVPGLRGSCVAAPTFVTCRSALSDCDNAETCDGTSTTCPADITAPNGTTCVGGFCVGGTCNVGARSNNTPSSATTNAKPTPVIQLQADGGCGVGGRLQPDNVLSPFLVALAGVVGLIARRRRCFRRTRTRLFVALLISTSALALESTANANAVWRQHSTLAPPDIQDNDAFGTGIAVDGTTAIVAAPGKNSFAGAVYVFERSNNDWILETMLTAPDGQPGDAFGGGVALSGDTAVVTASSEGDHGVVYVFVRKSGSWTLQARITDSDPGTKELAIPAVSGDTLVVGAPGSLPFDPTTFWALGLAFVYTRSGDLWTKTATLTGAPGSALFGISVSLQGSSLLVSASNPNLGTSSPNEGQVSIYQGPGQTWTPTLVLTPPTDSTPTTSPWASFGLSAVVDGDTLVVGQPFSLESDPPTGGVAHVYQRSSGAWTETQIVTPSIREYTDNFGVACRIRGDEIAVAAPQGNGGAGAAFVFTRTSGTFLETGHFVADDAQPDDAFGTDLGIATDMVLVGAPNRVRNRGQVYVFFHASVGDPCTSELTCISGLCIDGVCCDSSCGGGDPNDCVACSVAAGSAVDGVCGPTTPHICRPARDECDVAESCDGVNQACPADRVAENGLSCGSGSCTSGVCGAAIEQTTTHVAAPAAPATAAAPAGENGSSACTNAAHHAQFSMAYATSFLGLLLALIRRRRSRRMRS